MKLREIQLAELFDGFIRKYYNSIIVHRLASAQ